MSDKMVKMGDKYANLLIEVWETKIKVVDTKWPNTHVTLWYGELLEPGIVVHHKGQLWFYSKTYSVGVLHGTWTSADGEMMSVYDFLVDILNYGRSVEVAFDVQQFIPKEV